MIYNLSASISECTFLLYTTPSITKSFDVEVIQLRMFYKKSAVLLNISVPFLPPIPSQNTRFPFLSLLLLNTETCPDNKNVVH
nr:MAG TPA: hypothetical protein [Caudoviricetes sp.]